MHVVIITLCPEIFSILHTSILGSALKKNLWQLDIINMRDFATDNRKTVDDQCIGGGPGMLIKPNITHEAIKNACRTIEKRNSSTNNQISRYLDKIELYEKQIAAPLSSNESKNLPNLHSIYHAGNNLDKNLYKTYNNNTFKIHQKISKIMQNIKNHIEFIHFSPRGVLLNQHVLYKKYKKCSGKSIILLCGRYEGIDQRVIDYWQFNEISIGDYILTNGDIPALAFLDSYLRFVPGILGNYSSIEEESFKNYLLEANNYTKPVIWHGISAPDVLRSGNHALIQNWKLSESKRLTSLERPDLWLKHLQSQEDLDD